MNFSDQVVLITGASGSIGAACARLFCSYNASVILSGTNIDKLNELASECGYNATVLPCNLDDVSSIEGMMAGIAKIDVLVCNAGITKDRLSMRMSNQEFMDVININLLANFVLNKQAVKKMMSARYGRIINVSSVVGVSGNAGQANYCASKAGLIGMTKSIALEVASLGITVNCIAPGFIESNMTNSLTDLQKENIFQKIPQKSFGKPDDIAHGVAFLASREARYITGHTLHVNGGMLMV
jgi:3-oxoacyl-[acyl-carrier protein] reductase